MNDTQLENGSSTINHASRISRCIALFIDDIIIIAILYLIPQSNDVRNIEQMQSAYLISLYIIFFFFLLKDIFGCSPGKWFLGLRIVRKNDLSRSPNILALSLRNVPLFFGMIEPIVLLLNKNYQRIGDMIFGTYVISIHPKKGQISEPDLVGEHVDDLSQPSMCASCGAVIPVNESRCPKCGWSYKQ